MAARIVDAAVSGPRGAVVEIGPGRGALTGLLADAAGTLVLVELDTALADALEERFADASHVRVVRGDARAIDVGALPETEGSPYTLVGNLPYYAASPIVRRFLELAHPPDLAVVMVQREVAQTMCGLPGKTSLLSVTTGYYADAEIAFSVPPRAFSPPPEVHSSVVVLRRRARPAAEVDSAQRFFDLVRAGFAAPRKTVANSLAIGLKASSVAATSVLTEAGVASKKRPGTLTMDEWTAVYRVWRDAGAAELGR